MPSTSPENSSLQGFTSQSHCWGSSFYTLPEHLLDSYTRMFFQILTGCSVLNSLYQLDISLVEIYFIYTLKLGIGGCLSI